MPVVKGIAANAPLHGLETIGNVNGRQGCRQDRDPPSPGRARGIGRRWSFLLPHRRLGCSTMIYELNIGSSQIFKVR